MRLKILCLGVKERIESVVETNAYSLSRKPPLTTASTTISPATISSTASPTCINVAPGENGFLPPESCDAILYYVPSFGAAILFCVLYGLVSVLHIAQGIVYKKVGPLLYFNISRQL